MLRSRQEGNPLDTFFLIEITVKAPSGALILSAGPYLDLDQATEILMEYPEVILKINGQKLEDAEIGYIYECYIEDTIKILHIRGTEIYK